MEAGFWSGDMGVSWGWMVVMAARQCECTYLMSLSCALRKSQNSKFYVTYILPQFKKKIGMLGDWRLAGTEFQEVGEPK